MDAKQALEITRSTQDRGAFIELNTWFDEAIEKAAKAGFTHICVTRETAPILRTAPHITVYEVIHRLLKDGFKVNWYFTSGMVQFQRIIVSWHNS